MKKNFFYNYNYTMYNYICEKIYKLCMKHTACKIFWFNSICAKIILSDFFL